MAEYYVRSTDGDDGNNGLSWATAKATIGGALTEANDGDTIYVSQSHYESYTATVTLNFSSNPNSPIKLLCVNDSSEPPITLADTAEFWIASGGNSLRLDGSVYVYGITFVSTNQFGNGIDLNFSGNRAAQLYENCCFYIRGGSARHLRLGHSFNNMISEIFVFINTNIKFEHSGSRIKFAKSRVVWQGGTLLGSPPTALFEQGDNRPGFVYVSGVDLSLLESGSALVNVGNNVPSDVIFTNCKLGSGVALTTGSTHGPGSQEVKMHNCDSSNTNYRMEEYSHEGIVKSETSIVRENGASDGTTFFSWLMQGINTQWAFPLKSPEIVGWLDDTTEKTISIEIINDGQTLKNDEVWLQIEYLGTENFPQSVFINNRNADILSPGISHSSSDALWNNVPVEWTPIKQKLSVTFTPKSKGAFKARVMLAKNTIIYVCPKVVIN